MTVPAQKIAEMTTAAVDHTAMWLDFIAKVFGAAAWPTTLLLLAWIFYRPLLGLLEKIRQFEGWG